MKDVERPAILSLFFSFFNTLCVCLKNSFVLPFDTMGEEERSTRESVAFCRFV